MKVKLQDSKNNEVVIHLGDFPLPNISQNSLKIDCFLLKILKGVRFSWLSLTTPTKTGKINEAKGHLPPSAAGTVANRVGGFGGCRPCASEDATADELGRVRRAIGADVPPEHRGARGEHEADGGAALFEVSV